jgi:hypothetical protein
MNSICGNFVNNKPIEQYNEAVSFRRLYDKKEPYLCSGVINSQSYRDWRAGCHQI